MTAPVEVVGEGRLPGASSWRSEGGTLLRASVSSGAATLADGAVYQIFLAAFRGHALASYALASAAGAIAGAITNFSLNRSWVFGAGGQSLGIQGLRYAAGSLATLLVLQVALWVFIERGSLDAGVAWLPAKLVTWLLFSYPFQRFFVFPRRLG
ncbi:MAG TPA: GtrA family protein [Polyangiaceae bacterium]|nr:GtrA family protein [Polyangiaceae bacterium]